MSGQKRKKKERKRKKKNIRIEKLNKQKNIYNTQNIINKFKR